MSIARLTSVITVVALLLGCSPSSDKPDPSADDHDRRHVPLEGQPNFRDLGGYRCVFRAILIADSART